MFFGKILFNLVGSIVNNIERMNTTKKEHREHISRYNIL